MSRGAPGAVCPGDITGDHTVDVNDLVVMIEQWGACPQGCTADVAPPGGDHNVNTDDLLTLIAGWGQCPCIPGVNCTTAVALWCEDWELGDYSRWTSDYQEQTPCEQLDFGTEPNVTPALSHRSAIICATPDSHRGYGGLRFEGDVVLPNFSTPSSGGIDSPHGVVVSFWSWYSVPYTFSPERWMSLMTVTDNCTNAWTDVVTLNLDDSTMRIKPVHVSTVSYVPGAPSMPQEQWVRTTAYINYYTGEMEVWQNGQKICSATFERDGHTLCQWHFGLYASGENDDIVLYEEDLRIARLTGPLPNYIDEPLESFNCLIDSHPGGVD